MCFLQDDGRTRAAVHVCVLKCMQMALRHDTEEEKHYSIMEKHLEEGIRLQSPHAVFMKYLMYDQKCKYSGQIVSILLYSLILFAVCYDTYFCLVMFITIAFSFASTNACTLPYRSLYKQIEVKTSGHKR